MGDLKFISNFLVLYTCLLHNGISGFSKDGLQTVTHCFRYGYVNISDTSWEFPNLESTTTADGVFTNNLQTSSSWRANETSYNGMTTSNPDNDTESVTDLLASQGEVSDMKVNVQEVFIPQADHISIKCSTNEYIQILDIIYIRPALVGDKACTDKTPKCCNFGSNSPRFCTVSMKTLNESKYAIHLERCNNQTHCTVIAEPAELHDTCKLNCEHTRQTDKSGKWCWSRRIEFKYICHLKVSDKSNDNNTAGEAQMHVQDKQSDLVIVIAVVVPLSFILGFLVMCVITRLRKHHKHRKYEADMNLNEFRNPISTHTTLQRMPSTTNTYVQDGATNHNQTMMMANGTSFNNGHIPSKRDTCKSDVIDEDTYCEADDILVNNRCDVPLPASPEAKVEVSEQRAQANVPLVDDIKPSAQTLEEQENVNSTTENHRETEDMVDNTCYTSSDDIPETKTSENGENKSMNLTSTPVESNDMINNTYYGTNADMCDQSDLSSDDKTGKREGNYVYTYGHFNLEGRQRAPDHECKELSGQN